MSDNRATITKLAPNGNNWVTYRDRVTWVFNTRRWSAHLTNASVIQAYINAGNINGVTPQDRWDNEERTIKELIGESVPDQVFSKIKNKPNVMEIWATL